MPLYVDRHARTVADAKLAQALRLQLIIVLGGCCAICADPNGDLLEIDHPEGRSWKARECNQLQRVLTYWREYVSGVELRVLCRSCNARDGAVRRWA